MNWYQNSEPTKHKVFLSFYHGDDQYYRNEFEAQFNHLFINKSVEPGDIESDLSDEYIKRLIQEGYLTDSSVVVVLVGPKTYCRKHVDWEIAAGLNKKVGGHSGLVGILLPEFPLSSHNRYSYNDLPARLADNVKSDYSEIYTWDYVCSSDTLIKSAIQVAFDNRVSKSANIDNSRLQQSTNLCS